MAILTIACRAIRWNVGSKYRICKIVILRADNTKTPMATLFSRDDYKRIAALLITEVWHVNHMSVFLIRRREGLKFLMKNPKLARVVNPRGYSLVRSGFRCLEVPTGSAFLPKQYYSYIKNWLHNRSFISSFNKFLLCDSLISF